MPFSENDISKINSLSSGQVQSEPAPVVETPVNTDTTNAVAASTDNNNAADQNQNAAASSANNNAAAAPQLDLSKLGFQTLEDLQSTLSKVPEYQKQLSEHQKQIEQLSEYKNGPKFKSDRQKLLYDLSNQVEGMELEKARQLIEIVSLDLKNLPDHQVRFEAFKLKPENAGLSQDEIRALFADDELSRFGDPTENAVVPQSDPQKIRAKQATALAKAELEKFQTEWQSAKTAEKTPAELAAERLEYTQFLQQQTSAFDGISNIKLSATDEKGEKVEGAINFKIDKEKQLPVVIDALRDPSGWWDKKLNEKQILADGKPMPDFLKFADFVTRIEFLDELNNMAYQQGMADALANKLKGARNVADTNNSTTSTPPVTPVPEGKAANQAAMKVAGLIN